MSKSDLDHVAPGFLKSCRARPSWDPGSAPGAEDDTRTWQCAWESWVARLASPEAPWWHWSKVERFWVDANFLHGPFPEELARAWPAMRSLDLQLNEISGPLPLSLTTQRNLSALRVHRNRLEGMVPQEIFAMPNLVYTNFEGNAGLRGCLPRKQGGGRVESQLEIPVQGTKISGLCENQGSSASQDAPDEDDVDEKQELDEETEGGDDTEEKEELDEETEGGDDTEEEEELDEEMEGGDDIEEKEELDEETEGGDGQDEEDEHEDEHEDEAARTSMDEL